MAISRRSSIISALRPPCIVRLAPFDWGTVVVQLEH